MEKNTEFPSKNVRKNSLLFLDGVYKNSIYVQKIHAHVGVVPFLHYSFTVLLSDPRKTWMRGKKVRRVRSCVRVLTARMSLLRDAEIKRELIHEWVYFAVAVVIRRSIKLPCTSRMTLI